MITQDEIEGIISIGKQDGALLPEEERMMLNIFKIGKMTIEQVMIPRTDAVFLSADASSDEIFSLIEEKRLSRIPVFEDKKDNVVGILYVKDLIGAFICIHPKINRANPRARREDPSKRGMGVGNIYGKP